jgi:hypothetical protein
MIRRAIDRLELRRRKITRETEHYLDNLDSQAWARRSLQYRDRCQEGSLESTSARGWDANFAIRPPCRSLQRFVKASSSDLTAA